MYRLVIAALLFLTSCVGTDQEDTASTEPSSGQSVWTLDLIRTLPGQQAEYLRNIEANWAGARRIANTRGDVLSYRAFVAEPDSTRAWDVLLMTEYADSASYADKEAIFESIFASPEFVRVPTSSPSSELRVFLSGDVVVRPFVSEPPL